jgi:hypothetical protein
MLTFLIIMFRFGVTLVAIWTLVMLLLLYKLWRNP